MIVSLSRSPSRRSRSRSLRKEDVLDPRDPEMVLLFANGSKAKGALPPVRQSLRLKEVKQFITEHGNFWETKNVQRVTGKRMHAVTGIISAHGFEQKPVKSEEAGMGHVRVRTKTLLERLTQCYWKSDVRRFCFMWKAHQLYESVDSLGNVAATFDT